MSYRRKHFQRSSSLRNTTVIVPVYRPGAGVGKVHAVMGLEDGSTNNFKSIGTELWSTAKVSPGVGVLFTAAAVASDEDITFTVTGIDQFGDTVQETTAAFDNSATTWESTYAYAQVQSLKIASLAKATIAGSGTIKAGYSGTANMVIGTPAKLGAASELLGVMCAKHNHTRDENSDSINLTAENVNVTKHTFTLADGTGMDSVTVGGEDTDMILYCVLQPTSPSL